MRSQRVKHDWATKHSTACIFLFIINIILIICIIKCKRSIIKSNIKGLFLLVWIHILKSMTILIKYTLIFGYFEIFEKHKCEQSSFFQHFHKFLLFFLLFLITDTFRDFPHGPVTKTLCSQSRGPGLIPGQGTRSHMLQLKPSPVK